MAALRRIPALTPDSIWKTPRARLEAAVRMAGPYQDERVRALRAGADVFRRHPALVKAITGPPLDARRALKQLPQLGASGTARMHLFASDCAHHPRGRRDRARRGAARLSAPRNRTCAARRGASAARSTRWCRATSTPAAGSCSSSSTTARPRAPSSTRTAASARSPTGVPSRSSAPAAVPNRKS